MFFIYGFIKQCSILYLGGSFRALLFEVVEVHDFCHDESFFKVGVDSTGRLRRLGPFLQKKKEKGSCNLQFIFSKKGSAACTPQNI